jgi:hypothetical protein
MRSRLRSLSEQIVSKLALMLLPVRFQLFFLFLQVLFSRLAALDGIFQLRL